ncbi:MAG: site-specific DNA-methyltransferase [Firmicutes bacterium]|nr:site-specific DNA-methyltransferase [Bacillota bacterium]
MTAKQGELIAKLREMFQFGDSDLDFGIYRIMNQKRTEIDKYLSVELPRQITELLQSLVGGGRQADIAEIDKQILETRKLSLGEAVKAAAIAELEAKKKQLASALNITDMEADIYSSLTNFFSRYYDDGDFISQRRYKDGVYAIPYEGEEVKLHWANADQYYVKTSEYFRDFVFKTAYGKTVSFKLIDAEIEKDNNKGKNRYFQLYKEAPFGLENGVLIIRFEYRLGTLKQEQYIDEIVAEFTKVASKEFLDFAEIVNVRDGKSLLGINLKRYTARNTFDYFIHKDLNRFLTRELDFFIKNDVVYLDDIDTQDIAKTQEYLHKAKVIRSIGRKIIAFLAQIEDFQKKLFLKKKFVYETNYCITLDRVPEELYAEIAANTAQIDEWVKLFAIDEVKPRAGDLLGGSTVGFTKPLTVRFLKENPFLVLDTMFFDRAFKEKLIDSIDSLDEVCDGLLIHSENFQALNLLKERYKNNIDCIYGDPPYNAKSSEILYKNSFKHSSWVSLMTDRIRLASELKTKRGALIIAIDENEAFNLQKLLDGMFATWNKTVVTILHNPAGVQGDNFSYSHEYAVFLFENLKHVIGKTEKDEKSTEPFRDWGPTGTRNPQGNTFYPIYIDLDGENILGFGDACDSYFHTKLQNIRKESYIEVYPVGDDGIERKWVFARETVDEIAGDLFVVNNGGTFQIHRTKSKGSFKTVWTDKRYYANIYGSKVLNDIIGTKKFDFPKSVHTLEDCLSAVKSVQGKEAAILDYFAGSGTTGHAVVNLNRDDGGKRKYILIEMGEHFDSVIKPRIQKVIYSMDIKDDKGKYIEKGWRDGKPVSRKGSSHCFKYIRLESYEDSLNNIAVDNTLTLPSGIEEEYLLNYCLDFETKDSVSLLSVAKFDKPFDYALNITRKFENKAIKVDLVETFNYLLGLIVERSYKIATYDAKFTAGTHGAVKAELIDGDSYKFKMIEGKNLAGEKILVVWREMTGDTVKDNAALDAFMLKRKLSTTDFEYDKIYVNGDNNLPNLKKASEHWKVLLIEEEMKRLMFDNE